MRIHKVIGSLSAKISYMLVIHIKLTDTANPKIVELEEICQMANHFLPNLSNMEIWGQQNAL